MNCPYCKAALQVNFPVEAVADSRRYTLYPTCPRKGCHAIAIVGTLGHWDHGYVIGSRDLLIDQDGTAVKNDDGSPRYVDNLFDYRINEAYYNAVRTDYGNLY